MSLTAVMLAISCVTELSSASYFAGTVEPFFIASVNLFPIKSHAPMEGMHSPLNRALVLSSKSCTMRMKSSSSVKAAKQSESFAARSAIAFHLRSLRSSAALASAICASPSSSAGIAFDLTNS